LADRYFDTRALVYFYTIAKTGSYRRAAMELGISLSALSRPIQQLEQDLGVLLFLRGGRYQTTLTEAGRYFFRETGKTLQALAELLPEDRRQHISCG